MIVGKRKYLSKEELLLSPKGDSHLFLVEKKRLSSFHDKVDDSWESFPHSGKKKSLRAPPFLKRGKKEGDRFRGGEEEEGRNA